MEIKRTGLNSAAVARPYETSADDLASAVRRAIGSLKRWRVEGEAGGKSMAVRSTRLFGFEDDVTIKISGFGKKSEAVFESKSRAGHYDFGQNRRNLKELLEAIERSL
ncbi:MAG: DUF1499 domain-containing protein [Rubrobacteraceae bacterium]